MVIRIDHQRRRRFESVDVSGGNGTGPSSVSFGGAGRVIAASDSPPGSLVRVFQSWYPLR